MNTLNSKQQYAVQTPHKKVLIMAGAGTGKTTVLTHRILYLIEHNIKEQDIAAFTFTNKAANQMKTRLEHLLGRETKVILSTFHSFCYNHLLIPDFYQTLGFTKPPEVILDSVKSQIIKTILHSYDKDQSTMPYIRAISKIKNNTEPTEIKSEDRLLLNRVYQDYNQTLRKSNTLDFDDMVPLFLETIKKNPHLLQMTQYPYILVDECQDINQIQYELIKTLSQAYQNIYMVGDEDQLIYSFRSSNITILKSFQEVADETIILNQNYRSTKSILNLSNRLITHNKDRTPKELYSTLESNIKPIYKSYTSTLEEAKDIAQIIKNLKEPYEDIAILYCNNDQSYPIEKELAENHIPYTVYGAKPFFENKEIKMILYGNAKFGKTYTIDPISKKRIDNKGVVDVYHFENYHEAIVSKELWDKANEYLEKRSQIRKGINPNAIQDFNGKYCMSFKVKCGFCGKGYHRRTQLQTSKELKPVWKCRKQTQEGVKYCPDSRAIDEGALQVGFVNALKTLVNIDMKLLDSFMKSTEEVLGTLNP